MKKKIFLTGGNGFIGSSVINKLVNLGYETASYDCDINFINNEQYYNRCIKIRNKIFKRPAYRKKGDVRNISSLKKAVALFKPDIIVHLAGFAMARPLPKYAEQMIPINLNGTMNVLKVFENSSAEKIVYTSSSMAYGHFKQTPQTENFILDPTNVYGACKAAGEYFVKLTKKNWSIVRPTSVYGFTDCANRVSQLLLDAVYLKKTPWVIRGESLDFSYIDDVAQGFVKVITSDKANGKTFNISAGVSRSAVEFAEIIKNKFPGFNFEIKEPDKQQVYRGPLDIQHAKNILGYIPEYSLEKGIEKTISLIDEYNFYNKL